jgi:hypothetical protein
MLRFSLWDRRVLESTIFAMLPLATVGNVATSRQVAKIAVTVRVLEQSGPVNIVGIRAVESTGQDVLVHYRNTSSKRTLRIWLEAIVSGREGGSAHISSNAPNEFWPSERSIGLLARAERNRI